MKLNEQNYDEIISRSVELLKNGGILAYPTETFYGLGAKFDSNATLKRLYEIKQRPQEKAMPLIIGERESLSVITQQVSNSATTLIDIFWPGPLTLLLPARDEVSEHITAGTHKVAVRIPGESFALYLAKAALFPITATSANLSGLPPARDVETISRYFGDTVDMIIDGGVAPGGFPSTIVDATCTPPKIVREGIISREQLKLYTG